MTLIPNTFEPATVIASSDMNDNFQNIEDAVGSTSSSKRLAPPGYVQLGPRLNTQISAESDTVADGAKSYLHLSWNVEQYKLDNTYRLRRYHDGEAGVQARIGRQGFEIWSTGRTTGSIEQQLKRILQIKSTSAKDYAYLSCSMTNVDQEPGSLQEYRLLTTFFNTPNIVYENATLRKTTKTYDASDYGVPENAYAVILMFEGLADAADANVYLTQARSDRTRSRGYRVSAVTGKESAGQGIVPLGVSGAYDGKFVIEADAQWNSASLYIQGYLR